MAKLYANENFPLPVVEELRRLGHDVLTIQEIGQGGRAISDEDVLAFAYHSERMLLTFNRRHFARLHTEGSEHCGIIACTVDADFNRLARQIHQAIQSEGPAARSFLRVNRPAT